MTHREAGERGGRPRLPTLNELRQRQSLEAEINEGGMDASSNDYKVLRRLWLHRQVEAGNAKQSNGRGVFPH